MMRLRTPDSFISRRNRLAFIFAFCLLPLAFCLSACGPNYRAVVKADAATGYCPVCGMKVNAAEETTAEIYYNDGTKLMFESPGDLLTFYTAPTQFKVSPVQQSLANITKVSFKDHQTRQAIDGRQAALVYGSRVEGPMGPDFFAFNRRSDAETFVAVNGGKVIGINDVTPDMAQTFRHGH